MMDTITVIGSGTMGNGIAHCFAQYGFTVNLVDISNSLLEKGLATIEKNLGRQVVKGTITAETQHTTLKNIHLFTDLEQAVKTSGLVIEAATENTEIKLDLFRQLSAICSADVILASNTSSIPITKIASVTTRPERVVGMHFMNPVPLMKLVEIIKGYATDPEVVQVITQLTLKLEKIPVEVNDYPGFIANRILMPMINEAIYALYEGVAGVTEIDTIMKLGMTHPMGPLQLADFIGLDVCVSIMDVLYQGFGNPKYFPCPLLVNMVTAGDKGIKSGQGFYRYEAGSRELVVARKFSKSNT